MYKERYLVVVCAVAQGAWEYVDDCARRMVEEVLYITKLKK